jgi:hypothetical protein
MKQFQEKSKNVQASALSRLSTANRRLTTAMRSSVSTWRRKIEMAEIIVQKKIQQDIYVIIQTLNKHKQNQQDDLKK